MRIIDPYGRQIKNLRVIITTECNYRCIFCHSEGYYHCVRENANTISLERIDRIAQLARRYGIDQIKITGGEPLLRGDIADVVNVFKRYGFRDVSMVTNGSLLLGYSQTLRDAGLDRINISVASLRHERYDYITGTRGLLDRVIRGVKEAVAVGLKPVKINVVILKDINDDEWMDFIRFGEENGVNIQFIEFHTDDSNTDQYKRFFKPLDYIERYLRDVAVRMEHREMHARRRYILDSGVDVEIVRPMNNPEFCANCTRIRITPTGWKPCLLRREIIGVSKWGEDGDLRELSKSFLRAIHRRRPYFMYGSQNSKAGCV